MVYSRTEIISASNPNGGTVRIIAGTGTPHKNEIELTTAAAEGLIESLIRSVRYNREAARFHEIG